MNRVALALALAASVCFLPPAHAACKVTATPSKVVMENEHVRLELVPPQGGKISSFLFKDRDTDLTSWPEYGALEGRRWGPQGYERLRNYPYQATVLEKGPDQVAVSLTSRCTEPGYTKLTVQKTVRLRTGEAAVEVRYRFYNGSKVALPLGWWFFQDLAVQGKRNTFYAPTPQGVEKSVHVPGQGGTSEIFGHTADRFLYDVPRGWTAVISDTGVGAVATFDVQYTTFIYNFFSTRHTTFEWAFNQIELPAAKAFETTFHMFPIADIPTVDGAGDCLAASLTTPGKESALGKPAQWTAGQAIPVALSVMGAKRETIRAVLEARALPDGTWRKVAEQDFALAPGKPSRAQFEYQPRERATHVLRCRLLRGNVEVCDAERPVIYGMKSTDYALAPKVHKIGKELAYYRPKKKQAAPRRTTVTLPEDYQPTMEVPTPHVKWAKPWAAGKVRVLVLMHQRIMRQVVELAQRADVECDCVTMDTFKGKMSAAEMYLFTSKLKAAKHDVLVMGDYDWNRIPDGLRAQILDQTEKGKGLVIVGVRARFPRRKWITNDPFILSGVLPELGATRIRVTDQGKGRIALAPYWGVFKGGLFSPSPVYHASYVKPIRDRYSESFDYSEYAYAMNARLVYWAARRVPFVGMRIEPPEIAAAAQGRNVSVVLTNQGKTSVSGTLSLVVTNRFSDVATPVTEKVQIGPGTRAVTLALSPLAAGRHVADAWLRSADGTVVNWATTSFNVAGEVGFGEATMDKDLYADGDTARAAVSVNATAAAVGAMTLRWRMSDCFDRRLAQGEQKLAVKAPATRATVAMPIVRPLARYNRVRLTLEQDGALLAETQVGFPVKPLPAPHPFYFMAYGGWNPRYREKFGCNTAFGGGVRGMLATRQGRNQIAWYPIHRDFRVQSAGTGSIRPGCLTSPKFREECKKGIDAYAVPARLQGNLGILIADEWGYGGEGNQKSNYCHSPTCLAGFRAFLRKDHGNLDALNKCWGTAYRDWNEIVPPSFDETRKSGKWERWTDHRRFVESVVADFFGFCTEHARRTYPDARIGFSGTPNAGSFNGYDWSKLCKTMRIICSYGGAQGETIRSFKQPGSFTSAWTGYDRQSKNEKGHRLRPWFALFNDMDGLGYYISAYSPLQDPDWVWNKKAHWIGEQWQDLRRGIATLVRNGKRQNDGIAIHYSQSSIHGATIQNRSEQFYRILNSVCQLLEDLGFQYDFVAYSDIEKGALRNYRLLIMPYSQAVSPKEADQIEAFVRNGGTVLADVYPAVRDQHCKPAAHGLLDEVFGVRTSPADAPSFQLSEITGKQVPGDLQLQSGCAKIQLAGGTANARLSDLGNAPAWITNRLGRGRAILLNACFAGYSGYKPGGTGGEISIVEQAKMTVRLAVSDFGRTVLADAGFRPSVRIATSDGKPFLDAEVVRYVQGNATYVGVLPSGVGGGSITKADTQQVTIDFGKTAHVYELRTGKYFGEHQKITTDLTRSIARVFALMPQRLDPLALAIIGSPSRSAGIRLRIQTKDTGAHRVAHLSVKGPDRKPIWLHERDLIVRGGGTDWIVPLALNDPAGKWTVEARGTVDAQTATVEFQLP